MNLTWRIQKSKTTIFDGEGKFGQEVEAWILRMKKYFQIHDYSGDEKAIIFVYNLSGRALIQWEKLGKIKGNKERKIVCKQFKKYFKKYLFARYYDNKRKEFHDLNLGQLVMEEYMNKLLKLLRYVDYIRDERVKIQRFLNGLPKNYRDKIEFVDP